MKWYGIWECVQGRASSMAAPQPPPPPPPPSTRGGLLGAIQSGVNLKKVRILGHH